MPARKRSLKIDGTIKVRKVWVLYSTNRQFCFVEEISAGFFGKAYRCGCIRCEPDLVLRDPPFMPRQGEVQAAQPKG